MPLVLRPPTERTTLTTRLAGIGRDRRTALVLGSAFRAMAVIVSAVLLATALDTILHLPAFLRATVLVGTLACGRLFWVRGVRPSMRESVHPLAVALRLEEQFPRLNDSLASAVEFLSLDGEPNRAGGARFRRVAVARAEGLAERYNLSAIVPRGAAWRAFWAATAVGCLAAVAIATQPSTAAVALTRFVDPYGAHPWPPKTTISLTAPAAFPARLAKGDAFELSFVVRGQLPPQAVVSLRHGETPVGEEAIPIADAGTDVAATLRIDAQKVGRDFEVRIVANDADTGWLAVQVLPPPTLVPLDGRPSPQLHLTYPAYTGLPATDLPDGTGVIECVAGTRIAFRAAVDRPLVSASFRPPHDAILIDAAVACSVGVLGTPLSPEFARLLIEDAATDLPVTISGDGTRLSAEFTPRLPGLYTLRLTDADGLTANRLFDVRVFPDPAPVVTLARPSPATDPLTLLPTASLPIEVRAEDRTYGNRDLALEYRFGPDAGYRRLVLADLVATIQTLPAVVGTAAVAIRPSPATLDATLTLPVTAFAKPDGSPPTDGDTIHLRAAATDWDDVAWTKSPGASVEIEIRVLGRSGLDAMLQKELAGLRPDVLRLREEQQAVREEIAAVAKAAAQNALKPEDAARIARAEEAQRQIRNRIADPDAGLRAAAEKLAKTVSANKLPRTPTTDRVDAVAKEIGKLADEHLEAAGPPVAIARQEADRAAMSGQAANAPEIAKNLAAAADHQKAAEAGLDGVLDKLKEWGGAGEVRVQARILKELLARAAAEFEKATEKVAPGTPADKLTPAQKADLGVAADKLDDLADKAAGLVGKAGRHAAEKREQADAARAEAKAKRALADAAQAAGRPGEAAALRAAAAALDQTADKRAAEADALDASLQKAGGQGLPQDLKNAAEATRNNRRGDAASARQAAAARLDKLADALGEKGNESADELAKKRKDAADAVDELASAQDELRKKSKAANDLKDPAAKSAEFKKLAAEQETLRRKAEDLAEKLTRDRIDESAEAVKKAADDLAAARDQLDRGESPSEKQEKALDQLDKALQNAESEEKKANEQLGREKKEELADFLKALRDRQKATVAEAARLGAAAAKAKRWDRPLLSGLSDLEERQKTVATDLHSAAEKKFVDLPVFQKLAAQAEIAMERAARAVADRKDDAITADQFDPETETAANDRVQRPMKLALRRLDQILSAVGNDEKDKPSTPTDPATKPEPAPAGEPAGEPPAPPPSGVTALAQLKALRAVQADLNEATAEFAKAHPDLAQLTDDEKDELRDLEQTQRDVAELFDKLAPLLRPEETTP